jgi:hypothetical protein
VKDWEFIADKLSATGFSLGWVSALHLEGRRIWIVDAHGYGKRFIIGALVTALSSTYARRLSPRVPFLFGLLLAGCRVLFVASYDAVIDQSLNQSLCAGFASRKQVSLLRKFR